MHEADIEQCVGNRRLGGNMESAAVARGVGEDNEHQLLFTAVDSHPACSEVGQHAQGRVEIDRRSAQPLHFFIRIAGHDGIEAQAGDAGVAKIVGQGEVHPAHVSIHGDLARFAQVARNAENAREVVTRTERDDGQRAARQIEITNGQVHCPVPAANHHSFAGARTLRRRARQVRGRRAGVHRELGAEGLQMPLHVASVVPRATAAGGGVVDQFQAHVVCESM